MAIDGYCFRLYPGGREASSFVANRVVAEGFSTFFHHLICIARNGLVELIPIDRHFVIKKDTGDPAKQAEKGD